MAGCSTGEEVWSLAILLHEEGLLERTILYATDINPDALASAENGVFALDRIMPKPTTRNAFGAQIKGHVLAEGELIGTYTKR